MAARAVPVLGLRRAHRDLRRPLPHAKTRLLEMTAPTRFTARLAEPALKEDATSAQAAEQLPTYHAYSIDGDVEPPLVYVNYGVPAGLRRAGAPRHRREGQDRHRALRRLLAWHQAQGRGGARRRSGCLIYSDPRDDGYFQGDAYPEGAWRGSGAPSEARWPTCRFTPAIPLTPSVGATKDAKRLPQKRALPDQDPRAAHFVRRRPAAVARPRRAGGARGLAGRFAPDLPPRAGPAKVHLKLEFDWKLVPATNVIAGPEGLRSARRVDPPRQPPRRLGRTGPTIP